MSEAMFAYEPRVWLDIQEAQVEGQGRIKLVPVRVSYLFYLQKETKYPHYHTLIPQTASVFLTHSSISHYK